MILDEHYIDNLKLLWEEKIGNERELMMKATDRLIGRAEGDYGLPKLEPLRPKLVYEKVAELKEAPEEVRKIFSIEFGERADYTDACKNDLIELVRKHRYDKNSLQIQSKCYFRRIKVFFFSCLVYRDYSTFDCIGGWAYRKKQTPADRLQWQNLQNDLLSQQNFANVERSRFSGVWTNFVRFEDLLPNA